MLDCVGFLQLRSQLINLNEQGWVSQESYSTSLAPHVV